MPLAANLSVPDEAERVRDALTVRFEAIDVVVNAAAGHPLRQHPAADDADGLAGVARRWTENFTLNALPAVLLTEAIADRLKPPGGRIIFVSSIAAFALDKGANT